MNKPSPIVKYALMGIISLGIVQTKQLTQWVDGQIKELPVYGKQNLQTAEPNKKAATQPNPELVKSLVPIFIESSSKTKLDTTQAQNSVDAVFTAPVDAQTKAAQAPGVPEKTKDNAFADFLQSAAYSLTLEATSKNSAILNGKAYAVGDAIVVDGISIGTLQSVSDTSAVVKTPAKQIKVYLTN